TAVYLSPITQTQVHGCSQIETSMLQMKARI
ncbi:unnamed protein product, partial [Allacma fusca]